MGARENLQRLADKKQQEIERLEAELERAKIYLQAILDSMKVLPRELNSNGNSSEPTTLRPGTSLAKAREAILASGKPLHIGELLQAIGKSSDKKTRLSLSGSIAWYVRRNQVFTRPAPNTFGLIEMGDKNQVPQPDEPSPDLPDTFGG
ncbi:MAG: hypothetical protein WBS19_22135 [Candidatus Korobacteraceae bacterium]